MSLQKIVGKRVKAARKQAKLTQKQVAKISGLSQGTIARIENGSGTTLQALLELRWALSPKTPPAEWLKKLFS